MNDKTYKDVNGLEKDNLSLMYTLGEALGDLPTDDETQQAWAELEAKHYRTNRNDAPLQRPFFHTAQKL